MYCCGKFKDIQEYGHIIFDGYHYFLSLYTEGGLGERAGYFKQEIRYCPFCGVKLDVK